MSNLVKELIWHLGVALSLAILLLCTTLLVYSGPNALFRFPASTITVTFVLASAANNFTSLLAPKFRPYTIAIEATFLVALAAFIGLLEALSQYQGFEQIARSGDPIKYANFAVSTMQSLATAKAWTLVLKEAVFWQLSCPVLIFYLMRVWASRSAA